jgi:hypothetical protein
VTASERSSPELLAEALDLVSRSGDSMAGLWPRAAALLGRQALEVALWDLWRTLAPGLEATTFRTQLLCLPSFLGGALAGRVYQVWSELTRACHYHPYDLCPTIAELSGWLTTTRELIQEVDGIRVRRRTSGEAAAAAVGQT